jgi:hypothetical protein
MIVSRANQQPFTQDGSPATVAQGCDPTVHSVLTGSGTDHLGFDRRELICVAVAQPSGERDPSSQAKDDGASPSAPLVIGGCPNDFNFNILTPCDNAAAGPYKLCFTFRATESCTTESSDNHASGQCDNVVCVPHRTTVSLVSPEVDVDALAPACPSEDETSKLKELREKLAELVKAKVELQSEKSLLAEIARVETETANLKAAQKIVEAQQSLRRSLTNFQTVRQQCARA